MFLRHTSALISTNQGNWDVKGRGSPQVKFDKAGEYSAEPLPVVALWVYGRAARLFEEDQKRKLRVFTFNYVWFSPRGRPPGSVNYAKQTGRGR